MDSLRMYPYAAELSDLITIYLSRLITCLDILNHCISIIKIDRDIKIYSYIVNTDVGFVLILRKNTVSDSPGN